MYPDRRLRRLRSQLVLTFLISSLGIGIAIGLPVLLLINRQASSQAQLLLDQATLTTRAFLASETADLQNLALLTSQRPTLMRLLQEGDLSSLEGYLDTLRSGAGLDLILVCADGRAIQGMGEGISLNDLCQSNSQPGYIAQASGEDLYMHTAAAMESLDSRYKVVIGKRISDTLSELQNETGSLYFLVQNGQVLRASDVSVALSPTLTIDLLHSAAQSENSSLAQRAFQLNGHQYISAVLPVDSALDIQLVNALNVDNQIAIQQELNRTLTIALFLIAVCSILVQGVSPQPFR